MAEIGVRELKEKASEIIRRVREHGESFDVTYRGKVVATIAPSGGGGRRSFEEVWADMDELAEEIGKKWPRDVSAVQAVREQRRDL